MYVQRRHLYLTTCAVQSKTNAGDELGDLLEGGVGFLSKMIKKDDDDDEKVKYKIKKCFRKVFENVNVII